MTYERLVKSRVIEQYKVSVEEIAEHLRVARRDIHVAQDVGDLDWAFNIAYNGILQTALAYMYHEGYRPRGEGKHYNTFRFLEEALPQDFKKEVKLLQKLRKKRNQAVYDAVGIVSETEAKNIISFSVRFLNEILDLLPEQVVELSSES